MLFILNGNGVPSVASFVRLPAPYEDVQAPTAPSSLSAGASRRAASGSSWTASTDNIGVTTYDVYRSTTSGFTPSLVEPRSARRLDDATPIRGLPRAPTTTSSRQRTRPGTSAAPRTRRALRSRAATRPRPPSRSPRPRRRDRLGDGDGHRDRGGQRRRRRRAVQARRRAPRRRAHLGSVHDELGHRDRSSNGAHTLTAVARDAAGNTTTSAGVSRHGSEHRAAPDDVPVRRPGRRAEGRLRQRGARRGVQDRRPPTRAR